MTTEIATKTYQILDSYIDRIVYHFQEAGDLIQEYLDAAKREGMEEKVAWTYLKDKIPKSTYYRYLPEELKDPRKQNRKPQNFGLSETKTVPEESHSESASSTGPDGNEVEIEQEDIIPPIPKEAGTIINPTPEVETVTVPKVEYEELKEALTQATTIAPATQSSFKQKFATQKDITDFFIAIRKLDPGEGCLQYIVNENNEVIEYKVWQYCNEAPTG